MQKGKASFDLERCVYVTAAASIVGKKEGEGPLADCFDQIESDPLFGKKCWEEAESELQRQTAQLCLKKAGLSETEIRCLFAGDLLGQLTATSFGAESMEIPLLGVYSACASMGEALLLGAITLNAGCADKVMAMVSSHFAATERQFRFPLSYGNQRALSTTWTVTGCGSLILTAQEQEREAEEKKTGKKTGRKTPEQVIITGATVGKVVDMKLHDSMNMGAAMAAAAADTILQNFRDFEAVPASYDKIITGDLGAVGQNILFDFMDAAGCDIRGIHMDCGMLIYDSAKQDTHSGGSGCGCSAVTLCGYILPRLKRREWNRVLFVPTGALLSQISYNEGSAVPGIAHAVILENSAYYEERGRKKGTE